MAKVKRFIYNSDFMTIAKVGHEEVTATIPAKKEFYYAGDIEIPVKIPEGCFARLQVKYQGTSGPLQWLAVDSYIVITATQSGRQISYVCFPAFESDKLHLFYYVIDMSSQSSSITINSQTFTIILDFLQQPNT